MTQVPHDIQQLGDWLTEASTAVFFGGAGMSTESGIPDFRSATGLYTSARGERWTPEFLLNHTCFTQHPNDFYRFYRENLLHPNAKPNAGHLALARLEELGHLSAVVTQNIDGLHQAAGSRTVHELHGSVWRNHCLQCGRSYSLESIMATDGVPHCECGGVIRPDVVLYEEGLDSEVIEAAVDAIRAADVLIVGGTSLNVYPAAGLVQYYRGQHLVLVNKSATPYDHYADLVINDGLGAVLGGALAVVEEAS